jgi:hypothetical protein
MRRAFVTFVITITSIVLCGFVGNMESYYYRRGTVVECDNNTIVIVDSIGEEWICGNDYKDVTEGCEVKMKMFNHHTSNIFDDEIKDVKVIK